MGGSESEFDSILDECVQVTIPGFLQKTSSHLVEQKIKTEGFPRHSRTHRQSTPELNIAKAEFKRMEELVIARRSKNQLASTLHMIPKPSGKFRHAATTGDLTMI